MSFKVSADLGGLKDFQRALANAAASVKDIAPSLKFAADQTIVPNAQSNVRSNFETTGDFPERIRSQVDGPSEASIIVWAIYAAVQEYGGTFTITPRQRAFFWAKWHETRDEMWKALALSTSFTIPARPYLRPAIDSQKEFFAQVLADEIYLRLSRAL